MPGEIISGEEVERLRAEYTVARALDANTPAMQGVLAARNSGMADLSSVNGTYVNGVWVGVFLFGSGQFGVDGLG